MTDTMRQSAPYPVILENLVNALAYRPGWTFQLSDLSRDLKDPAKWGRLTDHSDELAGGLTLTITTCGYDSYHTDRGENYRVNHFFIVPAATYDERSWRRWLFDCFVKVETHEAMEFFAIDGARPYAPHHGPGNDPYLIFEHGSDLDVRTRFTGEVVSE